MYIASYKRPTFIISMRPLSLPQSSLVTLHKTGLLRLLMALLEMFTLPSSPFFAATQIIVSFSTTFSPAPLTAMPLSSWLNV